MSQHIKAFADMIGYEILKKADNLLLSHHLLITPEDIANMVAMGKIMTSPVLKNGEIIFIGTKHSEKDLYQSLMNKPEYLESNPPHFEFAPAKSTKILISPFKTDGFELAPIYPSTVWDYEEKKKKFFSKNQGWRKLWKYEETREFGESLVIEGQKLFRGFFQAFSYYDFDRDTRVFYPFVINYLVVLWRKIERETLWSISENEREVRNAYLKGQIDTNERLGQQYKMGWDMGYRRGNIEGKELAIDEILISYAHDVIREQRTKSQVDDKPDEFQTMVNEIFNHSDGI